jgi:uncharacterized protein
LPANEAGPLAAIDRIDSLDVLRGVALLGIFIMKMPGFSHSIFTAPGVPAHALDGFVAGARELLFAGKFNLLFGLVFGIGFARQTARLDGAEAARAAQLGVPVRRHETTRMVARRMAFLFVVGLVHAMLLWSGDVLLIYAVLGVLLLAGRRSGDAALKLSLGACLLFPAVAETMRPSLLAEGQALAVFQYEQWVASNDVAFGTGSLMDAMRETARIFDWSWRSPLGLYIYVSFFVQMATGIVAGFLLGRRGWPAEPLAGRAAATPAVTSTFWVAIACTTLSPFAYDALGGDAGVFVATLGRTIGRASLAVCYALVVVRYVDERPRLPRWLRPVRDVGRMPLTNYLLQTALASAIFFGWGLGLWNSLGATAETVLALALYAGVLLPFSSWWLRRFRHGPVEAAWRRFTYGDPSPST